MSIAERIEFFVKSVSPLGLIKGDMLELVAIIQQVEALEAALNIIASGYNKTDTGAEVKLTVGDCQRVAREVLNG